MSLTLCPIKTRDLEMTPTQTTPEVCPPEGELPPSDGYQNQSTRVPADVFLVAGFGYDPHGSAPRIDRNGGLSERPARMASKPGVHTGYVESRDDAASDAGQARPRGNQQELQASWRLERQIHSICRQMASTDSPFTKRAYASQLKACIGDCGPAVARSAVAFAASRCGTSMKTIRRWMQGHIAAELAAVLEDTPADTHTNAERMSTHPLERQLAQARALAPKRERLRHRREIEDAHRTRRRCIPTPTLCRLHAIGLGTPDVWEELGRLSPNAREKWVAEREKAFAARELAAKALTLRSLGFQSTAIRIPGETMAIYFDSVHGED